MYYRPRPPTSTSSAALHAIPRLSLGFPNSANTLQKRVKRSYTPRRVSPRSSYIKTRRLVSIRKDHAFYDFTVMTYNVLSQSYWKDEYDSSCPANARDEKYRRLNVMGEVLSKKPDILCLQELTKPAYDFFVERLKDEGYNGVYKQRPGWHSDGLAVFVNEKSGVRIVETKCVDLNTAIDSTAAVVKTLSPKRFLRNNIALLVMLDVLGPDLDSPHKRICLCNSHIYWNPSCVDVKLLQTAACLKSISEFISESNESSLGPDVPVVFAADLNSLPNSSVFDLLSNGPTGKLAAADLTKFGIHLDAAPRTLSSSYAPMDHPPTNLTRSFKGCIDYIWYSADSLEVTHLLEAFDETQASFAKHGCALPNPHSSSDHICLMSAFRFCQPSGDTSEEKWSGSMSASTRPFLPKRSASPPHISPSMAYVPGWYGRSSGSTHARR